MTECFLTLLHYNQEAMIVFLKRSKVYETNVFTVYNMTETNVFTAYNMEETNVFTASNITETMFSILLIWQGQMFSLRLI